MEIKYFGIEEIKKPVDGYVVVMNQWWALSGDNKVMVLNNESLQCNKHKKIADSFSTGCGKSVFIKIAYIPIEYYV